jgi:ribonuclease HI
VKSPTKFPSCDGYDTDPEGFDATLIEGLWRIREALVSMAPKLRRPPSDFVMRIALDQLWEYRARWMLHGDRLRSVAAAGKAETDLVLDHLVPHKVLATRIFAPDIGREDFARILREDVSTCVITKGEQKRLIDLGLDKGMPTGWDGIDRFARYVAAGISVDGHTSAIVEPAPEVGILPAVVDGPIEIYTDGACIPNPGKGGWGFSVVSGGREVHSACGGARNTTNNVMEISAVIAALRWLDGRKAIVWSDSQYVVKGLNEWRAGWKKKGWRKADGPIANKELWIELDALATASHATFQWCRGHVGTLGNERADELAEIGRTKA